MFYFYSLDFMHLGNLVIWTSLKQLGGPQWEMLFFANMKYSILYSPWNKETKDVPKLTLLGSVST